jgi:hypothetical protein
MEDQPKKRNPATEMFVSDVDAESSRIAVVGKIRSKTDTVAVLEDKTGSINLLFQKREILDSLEVGRIYRIIGLVLPHDQGVEIKVEIIQDFAGFDLEGYYDYLEKKKVK